MFRAITAGAAALLILTSSAIATPRETVTFTSVPSDGILNDSAQLCAHQYLRRRVHAGPDRLQWHAHLQSKAVPGEQTAASW